MRKFFRIICYHSISSLENRGFAFLWLLIYLWPAMLLRVVSFGKVKVPLFHWPHVAHFAKSSLVGVTEPTKRVMQRIEMTIRERAEGLQKRVQGYALESDDQFMTRLAAQRASIGDSARVLARSASQSDEDWFISSLDRQVEQFGESSLEIVVEWFRRRLEITLHVEQIMCSLVLMDGDFAEMQNGEGKTFSVAASAASLGMILESSRDSLYTRVDGTRVQHKSILVVTANEYLVRRDFVWLRALYTELGVSSGYLTQEMRQHERKNMYLATVAYVTGSEFGFDVLRNTTRQVDVPSYQLSPYCIIVDEADQLLLDEAETPHILSGSADLTRESQSIIPAAWTRMTSLWVKRYYQDNALYRANPAAQAGFTMMPAAKLLLNSKAESNEDWTVFASNPLIKLAAIEFATAADAAYLGNAKPGQNHPLSRVLTRLNGDRIVEFSRKDSFYVTTRSFLRWSKMTTWKQRKFALATLKYVFRMRRVTKHLVPYLDAEQKKELARQQATLALRPGTLSQNALEDFQMLMIRFATCRQDDGSFWRGIEDILLSGADDFTSSSAEQPNIWVARSLIPGILGLLDEVNQNGKQRQAGDEPGLYNILQFLMTFHDALNQHPNPAGLLERAGFIQKDESISALLFANRMVNDDGRLTAPGQHLAKFLVNSVCRVDGLGAEFSPAKIHQFLQIALHAHFTLKNGEDYVVDRKGLCLVNRVTGRREESKHFGQSRHPFVLLKEGLPYEEPNPILRTLTVASFIRTCDRLVGVSGTLASADQELRWSYRSGTRRVTPSVVQIPPHKPRCLKDYGLRIFRDADSRLNGIAAEVKEMHQKGRPVIVITDSVAESQLIHQRLVSKLVALNVEIPLLNASHAEVEEEVISKAGEAGAITVATQMAGRGTDIVLSSDAVAAGGLHVIVTPIPKSERIMTQAKGRAARQGDPGSAIVCSDYDDWIIPDNKFVRWQKDSMSEEDSVDGDLITDVFASAIDSLTKKASEARQSANQMDVLMEPFWHRILGWRESFVSADDRAWNKTVADVLAVYLDTLSSVQRGSQHRWVMATEIVVSLLDMPSLSAEDQVARLAKLWPGHLSIDESRSLVKALEKISALYPARSDTKNEDIDPDTSRHDAIGKSMWKALRRLDTQRFHRIQEEIYQDCPRGVDPEIPQLHEYLQRVNQGLIRGIDTSIFLREFHSSNSSLDRQIMGVNKLLQAAVFAAIRDSQPDNVPNREDWKGLVVPEWMSSVETQVARVETGTRQVIKQLAVLSSEARYTSRAGFTRIIDTTWSELMDAVEVSKSDIDREWSWDKNRHRVELCNTITELATRWQSECAIRLVEFCDELMNRRSTDAAREMPEPPADAVAVLDHALRSPESTTTDSRETTKTLAELIDSIDETMAP